VKTRYYTATTINGFIADANHSLTWLFQFPDLDSQKNDYPEFIATVGALVMGSHTYEWLLNHEGMVEHPEKWPYTIPTWVVTSRTLPVIPGVDVRFAGGDIREIHAAAATAAGGKDIWVVGGGDLAAPAAQRRHATAEAQEGRAARRHLRVAHLRRAALAAGLRSSGSGGSTRCRGCT
jgi:dihydrofolate reductase